MKTSFKIGFTMSFAVLLLSFQNFTVATGPFPGSARLKEPKEIRINGRPMKVESEHILVKFKESLSDDQKDQILARHNSARAELLGRGKLGSLHRVHVPPGRELETLAQLKVSPDVEFAELNELIPAQAFSNDSMLMDQWHLQNIEAPQAWELSTGANSVVVAILDSGVDVNHPDLSGRIVPGYNVVNGSSDVSDIAGHGTAVAGAAVTDTNNALGLASLCWNCKIMPLQIAVLQNGSPYGYYSTIASGMQWAVDHGARVLNCSYVGMNNSSSIASAATYVKNKGGVVFGSIGNDSQFVSSNVATDVMFVSSINSSNVKSGFSNYGPVVTLSAPGESFLTTTRGGGYSRWNGTSFASPLAAAVAALIWSTNPTLNEKDVRSILIQAVDDLGPAGKDDSFGYGKVNASKAVQLAVSYTPTTTSTTTTTSTSTTSTTQPSVNDSQAPVVSILSPSSGATVARNVSVTVKANDNLAVTKVSFYVDGKLVGTSTSAPFTISWNTKKSLPGLHSLTVKAQDAAGNVGVSAAVSVNVSR